jgi:DUF4097 and DUF4098 domain-containing protein YvlB
MRIRLFIALAAILASVACDVRVDKGGVVDFDVSEGGRAEAESTTTYPLAKGGRLEIDAAFSDIDLVKSATAAVEVRARRRVRAKTDAEAQELLEQQYSTVEATPDRVSIKSVRAEGVEAFRRRVRVDYTISVPDGSIVTIKNENGTVTLNGVDGRFTAETTNGRVHGRKLSGGLEAKTVNGIVILEIVSLTSDLRITAVNGHALIGLPPKLNATIDASAINGNVIVHQGLDIDSTTKDRQRLSGRIGSGAGPRIELHTTNGNVRLGTGEPPT